MADIDELPTEVTTIEQLIDALRTGIGAIGALDTQVAQMRGMFNDEDETIQDAVDAGEHADAMLTNALAFAEKLKADADFSRAMDEAAETSGAQRDEELLTAAKALTAPFPTIESLLAVRDDVVTAMSESLARSEDDQSEPADVSIGFPLAENVVKLIEGAARSAATPIEIAIHVDGGAVQNVTRTDEETRPASIYVHDHDVEGHDEDEEPLAGIVFENARSDDDVDECRLSVHTGGRWETAPAQGRYWGTLRSEAERLELGK